MKTLRSVFFALLALVGAMPSCGKDEQAPAFIVQSAKSPLAVTFSVGPYNGQCNPIRLDRRDFKDAATFVLTATNGLLSIHLTDTCSAASTVTAANPLSLAAGESAKVLWVKGLGTGSEVVTTFGPDSLTATNATLVQTFTGSAPNDPGFYCPPTAPNYPTCN